MSPIRTSAALPAPLSTRLKWRLLPFLFLLYVIAYLDRINVGFGALTMNRELGLDGRQYGLLSGIFFLGYVLFEVPSNLMLHRMGARRWIARILLTWGLVATLSGFARGATDLYAGRFLLGIAEAGFFPGVLYYLTLWFPQRDQARAISLFMIAIPIASVVGGPLSGCILDAFKGSALSSWRWLLILEGLPAIVCGAMTWWLLPESPATARFLNADEREAIAFATRSNRAGNDPATSAGIMCLLGDRRLLRLLGIHFAFLMGLYVTSFWMPLSIQHLGAGRSNTVTGFLVLIPNLVSLLAMLLVSRSSDRHGERHWHTGLPLVVTALGLICLPAAGSLTLALLLWCCIAGGVGAYLGPFWARPGEFLAGRNSAVGLALINSIANLGSNVAAAVMGMVVQRTGTTSAGYRMIAVALLIAAIVAVLRPAQRATGATRSLASRAAH